MSRDSLAVAIEALSWMAYEGIGERTALFRAAKQLQIEKPDELRQAHKLIMETARFQNRLDAIIKSARIHEIQRVPHGIVSFLRIVCYLANVARVHKRELIRVIQFGREILGWRELHAYERSIALLVSGSLIPYESGLSEFDSIALRTCHPVWFVERVVRHFGRDFALEILRGNQVQLPVYARLNTLMIEPATEIGEKVSGERVPHLDGVWKLDKPSRIPQLAKLWPRGFVIQDLASIVTGFVSDAGSGHTVLDVCAAPGNKTSHLAALMKNRGVIYSIDLSNRRFTRWKAEMKLSGVENVEPILADARASPINPGFGADVVLVDPPCSNTGVFARNPSIKWTITAARVNQNIARQRALLSEAADHVKPNGTLVYCTCSILPEENEFIIEDFLRRRREFEIATQSPFLGSPGLRGLEKCQRFYPHMHDCNGYFIAKLRRVS